MRRSKIRHEFVHRVPDDLVEGILYISIPYATVVHSCCCGCGNEVVTPLGPTDWELIYDGETVSLSPSIGSWSLPCRSHYWIRRNHVRWARAWSVAEIAATRAADRAAKEAYFAQEARPEPEAQPRRRPRRSVGDFLQRLWKRARGRRVSAGR